VLACKHLRVKHHRVFVVGPDGQDPAEYLLAELTWREAGSLASVGVDEDGALAGVRALDREWVIWEQQEQFAHDRVAQASTAG
jgi:hypothetical protein